MPVVVISTGGTIASTPSDEGEGASPELTGADLVSDVPGLGTEHDVTTHQFSNVPSAHFTLQEMVRLVTVIEEYDSDADVTGIVVTQGTDVLEEVAFFVDLCYDGSTPVVFTGAMRNPSLASPDGAANLLASVRSAGDPGARGRGTLVVFNDRIHRAADVTKMHSMNLDAFRSPEFGPLGVLEEGQPRWRRTAEPTPTVGPVGSEQVPNDVHATYATVDMSPTQLPEPAECDALCLATTGAGHVPPTILPRLRTLTGADIPVVATSRCPEGRLAQTTYDFEGSERTLRDIGCYFSERNLQKTRIGTIVGLATDSLGRVFTRDGPIGAAGH